MCLYSQYSEKPYYNERCLTLNHKIHVSEVRKMVKFMKISDQQKKSGGKRLLELGERCKPKSLKKLNDFAPDSGFA